MIKFWMNRDRYNFKSFKGNAIIILTTIGSRGNGFIDYIHYKDVRINKDLLSKGFEI